MVTRRRGRRKRRLHLPSVPGRSEGRMSWSTWLFFDAIGDIIEAVFDR